MRIFLAALLLLTALPLLAVQTWNHVTLVDAMCAASIKANPDAHTTECALHCGGDGMGLLTSDGTFLKFDDPGAKQALAELKGTKKKDHLRATVIGERTGDAIKVQSVKLD
jgi:hypothetical protein